MGLFGRLFKKNTVEVQREELEDEKYIVPELKVMPCPLTAELTQRRREEELRRKYDVPKEKTSTLL